MRLTGILIFFLHISVFARQDTIRISDLDQTLFDQSQIQSILLNSEYRPINFFYSNVFKYHLKPYTGVAIEQRKDRRILRMNLVDGRIIHLEEEYAANYGIIYTYDRLNGDTLARDSRFRLTTENKLAWTSVLFMHNNHLRFEQRGTEGARCRGYYSVCSKGQWCTDDNRSYIETLDGHQVETENRGRREVDFKDGKVDSRWHAFDQNGHLVSIYEANELGVRDGVWEGYFANGVSKERGGYIDSYKVGHWIYTDSTSKLVKEEWYSYTVDEYVWHYLDSVKTYYENGVIRTYNSSRKVKDSCFDESTGEYFERGTSYLQVSMEWYANGQIKSWTIDGEFECNDSVFTDTVSKSWYANGNLMTTIQQNNVCTKYFADGRMKSTGVPWYGGARTGQVLVIDSVKGVITDRTYNSGTLKTARDSAYFHYSHDSIKAEELVGAAIMGLYPGMLISSGGGGCYQPNNIYYPNWKDSLFVPANVVDSLGKGMLSIWNSFPDSAISLRDSLFKFAEQFHPSPNEWYYTIEFVCADTAMVMRNVRLGSVATGNTAADAYFLATGCKAVSCRHKGGKFRYGSFTMIIVTARPLNFHGFFRSLCGSSSNILMYCGQQPWQLAYGQTAPVDYELRTCNADPYYYYGPCGYYIFTITSKQKRLIFCVNSDYSTDFPAIGLGSDYYLIR